MRGHGHKLLKWNNWKYCFIENDSTSAYYNSRNQNHVNSLYNDELGLPHDGIG